jgi:hypothetical protein
MKTTWLGQGALLASCAIIGIAACSTTGSGALTCSGGTVLGTCAAVDVCIEYGTDWTVDSAEADCETTGIFTQGGVCSQDGVYGSCIVQSSGGAGRGYFYGSDESTMEAACANAPGDWCPLTFMGGGDDASQGGDAEPGSDAEPSDAASGDSSTADASSDGGAIHDASSDAAPVEDAAPGDAGTTEDAAPGDGGTAEDAASSDASGDGGLVAVLADASDAGAEPTDAAGDAAASGDAN